jgi:allantoinase
MDNELYTYEPIVDRPPLLLPHGKKLAFYVGLNVEHRHIDGPAFVFGEKAVPSPLHHGRFDYGARVGIWRLLDLFDEVGLRASAITNSEVCSRYPQIVEAGVERGWAWIAHGKTNSVEQSGMTIEQEEKYLKEMVAQYDAALPARPRGWLGPGLTETFETPRILAEFGFRYLLDWCCDDQPFTLAKHGLISVPYSLEVNDVVMWMATLSGAQYEEMVLDQFEILMDGAQTSGMIMALPLHPFVTGQPHLFKYLRRVLRTICSNKDVWLTTSDEIADHYLETVGVPDPAVSEEHREESK